ncbi:MAG: hypothetical protein LBJ08_03010, partial [Bifidobacteriaceae bacterium]|nr:hypothetical protein [Bifidobacteriaceae bacterium]
FEPARATKKKVASESWSFSVTVKKTTSHRAKTLSSRYCRAVQRLSKAKTAAIEGGPSSNRSEYRAYNAVAKADSGGKVKRYWQFLRDLGPGVDLAKVPSSSSVYLKYQDFKPSQAQRHQTKALARCVG